MIRIALTGSIGMGKTTVAQMFARRGVLLFDADAEVRALQGPNGPLLEAIERRFPGTVNGGILNRDALAARVLANPAELKALEAIVHPAVRAARDAFIAAHPGAPAILFDIPLLFETGSEEDFDTVIVVSAGEELQRARVLGRPGMTGRRLDSILARQMPDSEKRARADFVIDTNGDLSTTEDQVDRIIACLGIAARR
jgi:dephospho-CoA kinase